jgi:universal stress protein E
MKDSILLIAAAPKQHTPALQRAFDLAQRAEVPVHVCLFVHEPLVEHAGALIHPDVRRLAQQQFIDEHQAWLDSLVSRWNADGLRASGEVEWAPQPHEAVLAKVLERQPALVIKDVGHEPLLRRFLYTALDWKLLRGCPAPLMLVHGLSQHLPRRILAAVDTMRAEPDAGALNDRILGEALKQAEWADADVGIGHVFPFLPFSPTPYPTLERVYVDTRAADREAFARFADDHQVPPEARHWFEGDPVGRLVEHVREHAVDLVVLGSIHHGPVDRLLIGSTAETLLYQAPCDMLLVKPAAFAATLTEALSRRAA